MTRFGFTRAKNYVDFGPYLKGNVWVNCGRLTQEKVENAKKKNICGDIGVYGLFSCARFDGFPFN